MPIKKIKKVGSGISERKMTQTFYPLKDLENPDGPPNLEECAMVIKAIQSRNEIISQPWASQSDVILSARNRLSEIIVETPNIMEKSDVYNTVFKERDSEAWYLYRVDICAKVAEFAVEGNRPWEAVEQAMLIGEYLTELRLKYHFDDYVKQAKKAEENRLVGSSLRRKDSSEGRFKKVNVFVNKGHSVRNACKLVAKSEGSHESTIQKDYYAHKKRLKSMD